VTGVCDLLGNFLSSKFSACRSDDLCPHHRMMAFAIAGVRQRGLPKTYQRKSYKPFTHLSVTSAMEGYSQNGNLRMFSWPPPTIASGEPV
jgi:hypothetical protein